MRPWADARFRRRGSCAGWLRRLSGELRDLSCRRRRRQQARNPSIDTLRRLTPEAILNALLNGKMRIQAVALSDAERRAVAEFLGGRALEAAAAGSSVTRCNATSPFRGPSGTGEWNGWGNGISNTRFAKDGGLGAKDLPKLKLKWAFGFAGVTSARAQPALVGNRLFVASDTGDVHALDPKTGCAYWSFRAQATVRTALLVAPYSSSSEGNAWARVLRGPESQCLCAGRVDRAGHLGAQG